VTRSLDRLAHLADALRAGQHRRLLIRLAAKLRGARAHGATISGAVTQSDRVRAIRARANPVILDRRDRFVFFPNSKVAQRSIARDLLRDRVIVRKDDPRAWAARFDRIDDAYFARTFTFTVVRNPFDRVVSAFHYLRDRCAGREFNEFVVDVLGREGTSFDPHFAPQADGLLHDGALLVDHVGRFETLDRSWREIAARIDAPAVLPHRGRSERAASYAGYYGDEGRRVVERLYHDDLTLFGYAFDDGRRDQPRVLRVAP
jgi:hypothetical protein